MLFYTKMINQNSKITQEIKAGLGLSEITGYPRRVADAIIPVMPVNKKYCNVVKHTTAISPTNIYTTPTNADFYLCSAYCRDWNGGSSASSRTLTATINGVAVIIIDSYSVDVESFNNHCENQMNFNPPIKIDRGTNLIVSGLEDGAVGITGYTEEVTGD